MQQFSVLFVYDQSEVDGDVQLDAILQRLGHLVSEFDVLRKRIVEVPFNLDYPYLVNDPDFDLESHVRPLPLPRPGSWKELSELLANLHSQPVDMLRPLWEMYVIDGLDSIDFVPKGSFAVMLKLHHSIADGVTSMKLISRMHDLEPSPAETRSATPPDEESAPTLRDC